MVTITLPRAKGNTGERGPQGVQGPKGDKGNTGDTGPQGLRGEIGPQGPVGPVGPQGEVSRAELTAATSPLATRDGSNVEADAFRGAIGLDFVVTPEMFGPIGQDDDGDTLSAMLSFMTSRPKVKALISREHRITQTLIVPFGAVIEFGPAGKIIQTTVNNALDCSAGGFHLIAPRIRGPYEVGTPVVRSNGTATGIWIDGQWNGAGAAPIYVQGGRIDRPDISGFERSAIETRLWEGGVVTDPLLHDCGYAGLLNQNSKGFRGLGAGFIYNIGQNHPTGNAYGHTNTRRTDGVYGLDIVASPRSVDARGYGWRFRNILWNALDTHAGEDIVYYDCTIEECTFPIGIVGSSGTFGPQRCGVVRPIIRNDPNGAVYALIRSGVSSGLNPPIVIQGSTSDPAQGCFVKDAILEYSGEDAQNSGSVFLSNTDGAVVEGVYGKGNLGSLVVLNGGNKRFVIDRVVSIDTGSDKSVSTFGVKVVTGTTAQTGVVKNVSAEMTGDIAFAYPTAAPVSTGSATDDIIVSGVNSRTVPLLFGTGAGRRLPPSRFVTDGARVGSVAGWAPPTTDFPALMNLPAGQTEAKLVVPLSGLAVGDMIKGFSVVGQIESGGGSVTLSASLVRATAAAAEPTYSTIGSMTPLTVTSDTAITKANAALGGLTEVVGETETFAILLTGTTAAATDIIILGLALDVITP